jgi:hypothetical protein
MIPISSRDRTKITPGSETFDLFTGIYRMYTPEQSLVLG